MPLEAAVYIDGLVDTNPVGVTDSKAQGDDHLRLIKSTIKNTFPGLAGRAWRSQSKSGNYTLVATDNMTLINAATSFTLSATAAATLGNGFMVMVAANSNTITFDPNAAETVNGTTTITIPANHIAILMCTGSAWHALVMQQTGFEVGTRLTFQQTSAPAGWTKDASAAFNDAAIRVVTGSAGTGGTTGLSALGGLSSDGFTLTTAHLPASGLSIPSLSVTASGSGSGSGGTYQGSQTPGAGGSSTLSQLISVSTADLTSVGANVSLNVNVSVSGSTGTGTTGDMGTGGAHSHALSNLSVKFADVIVATKN